MDSERSVQCLLKCLGKYNEEGMGDRNKKEAFQEENRKDEHV